MIEKIPVAYDMETADPDDAMTLCFLTSHPNIDLRAVTVTPGSKHQVGLIKKILELTDRANIPVGRRAKGHNKSCVSGFHTKWLGDIELKDEDGLAADILNNVREKGQWGAELENGTNTFISVSADRNKFIETFINCGSLK